MVKTSPQAFSATVLTWNKGSRMSVLLCLINSRCNAEWSKLVLVSVVLFDARRTGSSRKLIAQICWPNEGNLLSGNGKNCKHDRVQFWHMPIFGFHALNWEPWLLVLNFDENCTFYNHTELNPHTLVSNRFVLFTIISDEKKAVFFKKPPILPENNLV